MPNQSQIDLEMVEGGEPVTVESVMKLDGLPQPQPSALDVPLGEINSLEMLDLLEVRTGDQLAVVPDRGFRRNIAAAKFQNLMLSIFQFR